MRTLRLTLAGSVILALIGGANCITLAQAAEAPEAASEMLFELSVPRWALPDDIAALEVADWTLEAGTDVTGEQHTSQAYETMRNRAIVVTSGTFLIAPTTDALLWPAPGAAPEVTPAGEAVTLRPGEAIFLPAVPADEIDPERYLRVANPGPENAEGFTFHAHQGSARGSLGSLPPGMQWRTWRGETIGLRNAPEWTAADEVLFQMARYRGHPGSRVETPAGGATRVYFVESGAVERTISGPGGEVASVWRAGRQDMLPAVEGVVQALTVAGDEAASFLELAAIPRTSTSE